MTNPLRLAILRDFPEEHWWSMDLAADMLLEELAKLPNSPVLAQPVCPAFHARFAKRNGSGGGFARNADRLLNRLWDYPRYVRRNVASSHDLFHLVDHSYSQLLHELPAGKAGVYCHDIDTFRCVVQPAADPRPKWFRAMARRILTGMQKASVVFYSTQAVRREIEQFNLVDPARLVQNSLGVSSEFSPADRDSAVPALLPFPQQWNNNPQFLLHVGSCIPRKRIDVLLDVFAAAKARRPELLLVQVGGEFTGAQRERMAQLKIASAVNQIRGVPRATIAWLYRRAALVLQPSETEGFGFPVIEALACGAPVLASDIPALHEAGEEAVTFCKVADVDAWANEVDRLLSDPVLSPPRAVRLAQAAKYSWAEHARRTVESYMRIV